MNTPDLAGVDARAIVKAVAIAVAAGLAMGAIFAVVVAGLAFAGALMGYRYGPSPFLSSVFFILGMLPNVLGGYLAATFAGRNEFLHGVIAGAALLVVNGFCYLFLLYLLPGYPHHPLMAWIGLFVTVPLAAGGAVIGKRTR